MFWIWFLFIWVILIPVGLRLSLEHPSLLNELLLVAALGILAYAAARILLARRLRRRQEAARAAPDSAAVAALNWPASLSQADLEAHCTAYLEQAGWSVSTAKVSQSDAVFLDVLNDDMRALIRCVPVGKAITNLELRALVIAAQSFPGARPVVLTPGKSALFAIQAASNAGVAMLTPADLARLPELAAPSLPPP
jgi:hypothetical protein